MCICTKNPSRPLEELCASVYRLRFQTVSLETNGLEPCLKFTTRKTTITIMGF